jgi:hypothetical protein
MGILQVVRLTPPPTFYDMKPLAGRHQPLTGPVGAIAGWQDELAFAALRLAYSASGGLARGDDIGRLLADHGPGTFISMAKLLEDEEIFGFEWNASLWIPMFQFGLNDLSLKPSPRQVRAALGEEFNGWTVAAWFVEPNVWLARRRPIDLLESELEAVLLAARADRFVAAG